MATASLLAARGYTVFGTSRSASGEKPDRVGMLQLDITSDESVNTCVSSLLEKQGRIDVLVNNAGQAYAGGLEETTLEEAKGQFESIFFGAVRMVNSVLPAMRRRRCGQIINVASIATTFPIPFTGYYGPAKAALTTYSEGLRQEVKSLGINVSVIEPGFFNTKHPRIAAARSIDDYNEIRRRAQSANRESFEMGRDPKEVAEIILKIIESPSPRFRYVVGREKKYLLLKRILPESIMESQTRKHWRLDD
jgi:short-subunit dehydrogenase